MNERHAEDNRRRDEPVHNTARSRRRDRLDSGACGFKDRYPRDIESVRDHFGYGHFASERRRAPV